MTKPAGEKVEMLKIVSPQSPVRVDARKYAAVRAAYLRVLPKASPGLTAAEVKAAALPLLPDDLFPGGEKAGWWLKGVQLDLEARGLVVPEQVKPLRFHRAGD